MLNEKIKYDAITEVVKREGGYVNHKDDRGGKTCWGVTEEVARQNGYDGDMRDYSLDDAIAIYDSEYWQKMKLDCVSAYSVDLACKLFDFGVNCGIKQAGSSLQRLLNSLNNCREYYNDLTVDGFIGSNTISAINSFHKKRGDKGLVVLGRSINAMRITFYVHLSEKDEGQEVFTYGWLSRTVDV